MQQFGLKRLQLGGSGSVLTIGLLPLAATHGCVVGCCSTRRIAHIHSMGVGAGDVECLRPSSFRKLDVFIKASIAFPSCLPCQVRLSFLWMILTPPRVGPNTQLLQDRSQRSGVSSHAQCSSGCCTLHFPVFVANSNAPPNGLGAGFR